MPKLRDLLRKIASDPADLQLLRDNPKKLAEKHSLSAKDIQALSSADLLIRFPKNPLGPMQTTNPITITVTRKGSFHGSGDPPTRLDQIEKERIIELFERSLVDRDFAENLRSFLKLEPGKKAVK
ncbi:hypothetical protein ABEG18_02590 [Alsobacter sp. KACC 23698]|uniref:Uncharacterized protein n=1 Tax=Alsobacter sp. KACC 23698 TaxID=3149229 RepID=A0AAU7JH24_9HYPH